MILAEVFAFAFLYFLVLIGVIMAVWFIVLFKEVNSDDD
jgi:hypothetical protein